MVNLRDFNFKGVPFLKNFKHKNIKGGTNYSNWQENQTILTLKWYTYVIKLN